MDWEVIEQVKLIPFDKIPLHKMSALVWDAMIDVYLPTKNEDKEEFWEHGLYILKDKNDIVKVYSTSGSRYIQIKDIYLLYLFFEKVNSRSDIPIAVIPLNLWKKRHPKPNKVS